MLYFSFRLPSTDGISLLLHLPIRFQTPLKIERTVRRLCTVFRLCGDRGHPSRLPPNVSIYGTVLGLCSRGSISPGGDMECD